jgi:hypothetical protein
LHPPLLYVRVYVVRTGWLQTPYLRVSASWVLGLYLCSSISG